MDQKSCRFRWGCPPPNESDNGFNNNAPICVRIQTKALRTNLLISCLLLLVCLSVCLSGDHCELTNWKRKWFDNRSTVCLFGPRRTIIEAPSFRHPSRYVRIVYLDRPTDLMQCQYKRTAWSKNIKFIPFHYPSRRLMSIDHILVSPPSPCPPVHLLFVYPDHSPEEENKQNKHFISILPECRI